MGKYLIVETSRDFIANGTDFFQSWLFFNRKINKDAKLKFSYTLSMHI